jgi:hypothetical protein
MISRKSKVLFCEEVIGLKTYTDQGPLLLEIFIKYLEYYKVLNILHIRVDDSPSILKTCTRIGFS